MSELNASEVDRKMTPVRRGHRRRRWLLSLSALAVALVLCGLVLARHGSRRDVDANSLLEEPAGFSTESTHWQYERDIPMRLMDGDLWPSDKVGRIWRNSSGRLSQNVYKYSSPGLARLEFARSDPAVVYCDQGECDGTRSVVLRAPASSDAYKAVCIKGDDYCTNYMYVGRFGQYIVEVQYNASLSGPALTDEGFSVVAAHFEDVVAFKLRS